VSARGREPTEAGFTLIETLVTVVVVGITFVVFVGGMGTSIVASRAHRRQAVGQASIRNFAEAVKAASYDPNCATAAASYASEYSPSPPTRNAAGGTQSNGSSHVAPSVAPTRSTSELLAFYTLATGSSFTPQTGSGQWGTDSERWDIASTGVTQANRVTASLDDQALTAAGDSGPRAATSATPANSIVQTVSLESAGGTGSITRRGVTFASTAGTTSLSLDKPTGTVAGDSMIAQIAVRGGTATTVTPPVGWLLVDTRDNGLSIKSMIYERTATGPAASTYTWGFGSSPEAAGGIASYGGAANAFTSSVTSVKFWDGTAFATSCPASDGGLQLISLRVASVDGNSSEAVEVVKRVP
jgi:prepilin-type N-terminal cleavage/methylation domain-containing protein